jgi:hypothetical protein
MSREENEMSEQQFTTNGPVRLAVRLANGEIEVETVEGAEATVTIEGPPKLTDATAVALLGDRLTISQERRMLGGLFGWFDHPLQVTVTVPHASQVEIVTGSGNTRITGNFTGLDLKSASGDLDASGLLDGDASVKTVSGDVRLQGVTGDLYVKTVSGDVSAGSVHGSVSLASVSGDVRIGSLHDGEVRVQSVSGDVELGVAHGTSIELEAASASGHLSTEIPLSDRPAPGEPGPSLVIRGNTVSGDIRVLRAA